MAWYPVDRWLSLIDWAALHGVNLPLAFTGQEYVWYALYHQLGLSDDEIADYISGAAFLAWNRMGNIQKWAGPLESSFREVGHSTDDRGIR